MIHLSVSYIYVIMNSEWDVRVNIDAFHPIIENTRPMQYACDGYLVRS